MSAIEKEKAYESLPADLQFHIRRLVQFRWTDEQIIRSLGDEKFRAAVEYAREKKEIAL